ncbi:hypothetical protein K466DRAFT_162404 [Polyporus arcularius HHB13444]|uniref:Secreted protein n=1 Tax=Polyporus arcularius HHB13444 TaxID=1314778 RepID=A0A5C3P926_9APHY|nr:hypothetical protein K466DRAFT_162404 [Polyporus arcularius HHB13444]
MSPNILCLDTPASAANAHHVTPTILLLLLVCQQVTFQIDEWISRTGGALPQAPHRWDSVAPARRTAISMRYVQSAAVLVHIDRERIFCTAPRPSGPSSSNILMSPRSSSLIANTYRSRPPCHSGSRT